MLDTDAGWRMAVIGNAAGGLYAAAVLALTVVSVPMLLDRTVPPFLAMQASMRAVAANPAAMAL